MLPLASLTTCGESLTQKNALPRRAGCGASWWMQGFRAKPMFAVEVWAEDFRFAGMGAEQAHSQSRAIPAHFYPNEKAEKGKN